MISIYRIAFVGFLSLFVSRGVDAAIVQYADRDDWMAAAPGGGPLTDSFGSYTADVIFRPGRITTGSSQGAAGANASKVRHFFRLNSAAFSMGTLTALGYDWNYLNLIDTPPLAFCGNNALVQLFLNATEPDRPGTMVRIDFTNPVAAWGADFYFARESERLAIDVLGPGDALLGTLFIPLNNSFLGFVATAGEQVHALLLRTELLIEGPPGEAMCMDDVIGSPAPP